MDYRYIKDFVIILAVIMLISFAFSTYYLYQKQVNKYPYESQFTEMAIGEKLLGKIHEIENNINERKQFVFKVEKDPLQQNLIVKTKIDLELQWKREIESMIRLSATMIQKDRRLASIAYKGENKLYKVGDVIEGREITDIGPGYLKYEYRGTTGKLLLQPIPDKPVEIDNNRENKEYNW